MEELISKLTDLVLIITGFELITLIVVLIFLKQGRTITKNLLIMFLATKAIILTRWFLFKFDFLTYERFFLFWLYSGTLFFWLAPAAYLYIKALCFRDWKIKVRTFFHLIPLVLIIIYSSFTAMVCQFGWMVNDLTIWMFANNYSKVFWTANFIQILGYIIAGIITVNKYRRRIKQSYSSVKKINMNWFTGLIAVLILHWIFVVTRAVFSVFNLTNPLFLNFMDLFSITIFLVFATILVFKGLYQSKIFSGIDESMKYQENKIPSENFDDYVDKITSFMKHAKPYLEPTLTIDKFAKMIHVSPWIVSRVINESLQQNFFNFVNSYRIEEVKKMLMDEVNSDRTILEIMYECGFNSKSSFNSVFKKQTGLTPSQYRVQIVRSKTA
ncbi:MAG: hypothetical protein APR63_05930 [Desulfuromonas sp. SDB]|nr:MAG: hypothetical protein APR63_05930 [Desulfuromonas sp. SDB]